MLRAAIDRFQDLRTVLDAPKHCNHREHSHDLVGAEHILQSKRALYVKHFPLDETILLQFVKRFGTPLPSYADATDQQFLGMQGAKPWTYLRFKLPSYTTTGIDGEITLHYSGTTVRRQPRVVQRKPATKTETKPNVQNVEEEFGTDSAKLSLRIANPAVRKQLLSDVNEAFRTNASHHAPKMTAVTADAKQVTFTHNENFGAWVGKPVTDVAQPDVAKENRAAALNAILVKYSAQLQLSRPARQNSIRAPQRDLNNRHYARGEDLAMA
jgi:hypothetical protein